MAASAQTVVIVPAAGRGERMGPGQAKVLRLLGGVPMLVHAVRSLSLARSVGLVVVAAPAADVASVRGLLADHHGAAELRVVAGGGTRQASVRLALAALPPDADVVLVHDGARPLVPVELVETVVAAVRAGADAVVPALPVTDTIKRVDGNGVVAQTLDRASLWAVQTPQGFSRRVLESAHAAEFAKLAESAPSTASSVSSVSGVAAESMESHGGDLTDDAGLVERHGARVLVIRGAEEAFKVTRPLDLLLAEAVLAARRAQRG